MSPAKEPEAERLAREMEDLLDSIKLNVDFHQLVEMGGTDDGQPLLDNISMTQFVIDLLEIELEAWRSHRNYAFLAGRVNSITTKRLGKAAKITGVAVTLSVQKVL